MKKVAIIYWSGTGNTELMAKNIKKGLKESNFKVDFFKADEFDHSNFKNYNNIVFGCPAMGDEELEDTTFKPLFDKFLEENENKNIAIFGSYGWGNQVWLENWENLINNNGKNNLIDKLALFSTPTTEEEEKCYLFGKNLFKESI